MLTNIIGTALFALAIGSAANVIAAPLSITLPPETAKLRPSTLPGYHIAVQKCATCHSADYVNYQPPGMTLKQWTAEMGKMQHVYGAPITDDDVKLVGAYLAVAYGGTKESELTDDLKKPIASAPTIAPSTAAPVAAAKVIDVNALLAANGCLACHGIDKKIVGPAYHDVAAKFKEDAQATSKLEISIRNGSVGKWGDVPMPPFSQLSPEDIHALAEFVLKQ